MADAPLFGADDVSLDARWSQWSWRLVIPKRWRRRLMSFCDVLMSKVPAATHWRAIRTGTTSG